MLICRQIRVGKVPASTVMHYPLRLRHFVSKETALDRSSIIGARTSVETRTRSTYARTPPVRIALVLVLG